MTRSTPEGARDYLVPSRVQPGNFYALPQSPQIFKQLLMVSGFDKYFQIVRCFRDEDLRADRQPEFTQIDLEMSFPQEERIFEVIEPLVQRVCQVAGFDVQAPFPRLTYAEAMRSYGSDKPDRRIPAHVSGGASLSGRQPQRARSAAGGHPHSPDRRAQPARTRRVEGLRRGARPARLRRSQARGARSRRADGARARTDRRRRRRSADAGLLGRRAERPSPEETVFQACGQLRLFAAQKYNDRHKLLDPRRFEFLWVLDFPMFEWDDEERRWNAAHHPFTSVHDEDLDKLTSDPARCRAKSYDLVLNGTELGSGSIRIHRRDVQSKVFAALGFSEEEARRRFGFLLEGAGIRRAAARRHRPRPGPPGDDPGGRDFHPRRHPVPQDRARHGPDVRRAGPRAGQGSEGSGHRDPAPAMMFRYYNCSESSQHVRIFVGQAPGLRRPPRPPLPRADDRFMSSASAPRRRQTTKCDGLPH
jgi:aspartyl-tRNA synthetase